MIVHGGRACSDALHDILPGWGPSEACHRAILAAARCALNLPAVHKRSLRWRLPRRFQEGAKESLPMADIKDFNYIKIFNGQKHELCD